MIEVLAVLITGVVSLVSILLVYARWHRGTLEAMGLPVDKPHWFFGNIGNYDTVYHHWEDVKRSKRLGGIYGYYDGRTPTVHVTDVNIIHKILFSESDHFAKISHEFGHPIINEMIEFLNGEKWKIVRNILSPQFTTAKLKLQTELAQGVYKTHLESLKARENKDGVVSKVDLHEFIAPIAVHVIAEMMCGIKLQNPTDPDNQFIASIRKAVFDGIFPDWTYKYVQVFPIVKKLIPIFDPDGANVLKSRLDEIMSQREKSNVEIADMVSVLLEMKRRCKTEPDYARLGITENTVYGQAMEFFIASYHGLVIYMKEMLYFLAENEEIYEKANKELHEVLKKHHGKIDYDSVVEMDYLGACVQETMRISAAFFRPDRVCIKPWTYEGITIPKGMSVVMPVFPVHFNEEFYPDPEKFQPERFLGEEKESRPVCAFLTFGQGPRMCMGSRLAIHALKQLLANILLHYDIKKRPDTERVEKIGSDFLVALEPMYLDFVRREKEAEIES